MALSWPLGLIQIYHKFGDNRRAGMRRGIELVAATRLTVFYQSTRVEASRRGVPDFQSHVRATRDSA